MPRLTFPASVASSHYTVTTMDVWGRISDRSLIQLLGWLPGHPVALRLAADVILVSSQPGAETITNQGHLRLPAPLRHACRLNAGDHLLLGAFPECDLLVAYTRATVEGMVLNYHRYVSRKMRGENDVQSVSHG